jgi:hypothetical protein
MDTDEKIVQVSGFSVELITWLSESQILAA